MTDNTTSGKRKKGGKQPGAGRPPGALNKTTLEAMEVKRQYLDKVRAKADRLFNAQMNLAEGVTMLFKIRTGKDGKKGKPQLVTSEAEISRFIDECGGYEGTVDGSDYYFLTTKAPDSRTITDMLDRALGKPEQAIDLTSNGESVNAYSSLTVDELRKLAGK